MAKIVHLCMCGPVTDGWSYQENLLVKYHRKMGHDVSVIASEWIWGEDGNLKKDRRKTYVNEHDVTVIRLAIEHNKGIEFKFKKYVDFYKTLEKEKPDILFVHGCQFLDIWKVRDYLKRNTQVKAYIDNHADFSNSGTTWLSKNILHGIVWKAGAIAIEPYIRKFYGVLPARVDFLKDMYGLPKGKIELLVMGADDELVEVANCQSVKDEIRKACNFTKDNFVIVTGGKIDYAKRQTLLLIKAIQMIPDENLRLIIFGSVEDAIKDEFYELCGKDRRIQYIGWISVEDSYKYFAVSDLAVFPGRHSVMWEQVVGQGIPLVCKYWEGTTHIDIGGNVRFIYEDSVEKICEIIEEARNEYSEMKKMAVENNYRDFLYQRIAAKAIEE